MAINSLSGSVSRNVGQSTSYGPLQYWTTPRTQTSWLIRMRVWQTRNTVSALRFGARRGASSSSDQFSNTVQIPLNDNSWWNLTTPAHGVGTFYLHGRVVIPGGTYWADGYSSAYDNEFGGEIEFWTADAVAGMQLLRQRMGLPAGNGDIVPKVFKALLNMDAFVVLNGGSSTVRSIQQALNGRYINRQDFYIIPTDGLYNGDVQTALLYAIQYELGLADGVANGNFGPTTKSKLAAQANLSSGSTDTSKYYVHLYQAALIFNGYSVPFDGVFGSSTVSQTTAFQNFVKLTPSGTATVQTWGSLLVSTGDADRPGAGADCVTTITSGRLASLQSAGYTHFGRYLTNTPDNELDKCIQNGELARIFAAGGRVFPLLQTGGGVIEHFTSDRGREVGQEAASAAWAYRIPANTIIYFSVDFDATVDEVVDSVIPYFQSLSEGLGRMGRTYRIGVYAPRRVCHQLNAAGLVVSSFVSDMSTGYGSNMAQVLPGNWAFDQIQTRWEGTAPNRIEIDKNIVSGQDGGFNTLTAF